MRRLIADGTPQKRPWHRLSLAEGMVVVAVLAIVIAAVNHGSGPVLKWWAQRIAPARPPAAGAPPVIPRGPIVKFLRLDDRAAKKLTSMKEGFHAASFNQPAG